MAQGGSNVSCWTREKRLTALMTDVDNPRSRLGGRRACCAVTKLFLCDDRDEETLLEGKNSVGDESSSSLQEVISNLEDENEDKPKFFFITIKKIMRRDNENLNFPVKVRQMTVVSHYWILLLGSYCFILLMVRPFETSRK